MCSQPSAFAAPCERNDDTRVADLIWWSWWWGCAEYESGTDPKLASVMHSLTKHRTENKLKQLLNKRSSMERLQERGVLRKCRHM